MTTATRSTPITAIDVARVSFWAFCRLQAPDFYRDDRPHLHILADTLQRLWDGNLKRADGTPYRKLIIEIPPRFGKSRTLIMFTAWIMGRDPRTRVITASYGQDLAQDFSKYTRNTITEEKNTPGQIVFSDVFPGTRVKQGDGAYHRWALEGQFFNYLGTGIGGRVTGKGGGILIVDDPVKNEVEARSATRLEAIHNWYTGTWLSRAEKGALHIITQTPWAKGDLSSRVVEQSPEEWYILSMPAYTEEGGLLCPDILPEDEFEDRRRNMDPQIFAANYMMQRIDVEGRLYSGFLTYDELPTDDSGAVLSDAKVSYTDTADEGDDYLCHIAANRWNGLLYITDVLYTRNPQEVTEPQVVESVDTQDTRLVRIESNNGGRAFARNVKRLLDERRSSRAVVSWFHQSQNKRARILTNAPTVIASVRFPADWRHRWPDFYDAMVGYQREGKNAHDDGPDAITGLIEHFSEGSRTHPRVTVTRRII